MTSPTQQNSRKLATNGKQAEALACAWLQERGLVVLERNYHCAYGELDIIAQHGDTLVFVEVRYRNSMTHGGALTSVDYRKQQRLIYTAQHYLQAHQITDEQSCRFDVVGMCHNRYGDWQFHWLPSAFCSTEYDV